PLSQGQHRTATPLGRASHPRRPCATPAHGLRLTKLRTCGAVPPVMTRHSASRPERTEQHARCRRSVFGYDALATPPRRYNDRKYRLPVRRWHRGSPVNRCYDATVNDQLDKIDEPPV